MKATWKKQSTLIAAGTAVGLMAGGAAAWWLLGQHTPIAELPSGADVLPENTAVSLSVSTDAGQWRRLRQYGSDQAQGTFDQQLVTWRDRLFYENGLDYRQHIQPWVGEEITVAFLNPDFSENADQEILPYRLPNAAEYDRAAVMIMPIANTNRAQAFWSQPTVREGQDWANREYKGIKIREVHGQERLDYALAKLDDRFLVASGDPRSVEQVIETFRGETAVARNADYGKAFSQLRETVSNPFMRLYINVPAAREFTATNTNQPIPPQLLTLLQNNQGLASAMTLEADGLRFRGVSWLAANSRTRLKVANAADRMPVLLPQESVFMTSGDDFQQFWQTYSQSAEEQAQQVSQVALRNQAFSPDTIQRTFNNLTGLDWEQDIIPWTGGEYALSLLSAPATDGTSPTSGLLFLLQVSDRSKAETALEQLDLAMQERNGWQVQETEVEGQSVTRWTSPPFGAFTLTRGWLEGDVMFLALGTGDNFSAVEAILPAPALSLTNNDLFRTATTTDLRPNSGHVFLAIDSLLNPDINLPVPVFSPSRGTLGNLQAIGLTTAVQDNRTTRHDARILLPRGNTSPGTLPPPGTPLSPPQPIQPPHPRHLKTGLSRKCCSTKTLVG
ncbi:DUF3352 domain-containing protein [Egbenema bharatensis]|uniref:DUF3352 domain-containing protein n=1 Tax=Egbenema bharatensis TaxID=3463334 RepID=UPI003A8C6085